MLSLNPPLLSLMDTPHLISALEAEGPLTSAEKELCTRLSNALLVIEERDAIIKTVAGLCEKMQGECDIF